MDEIIAAFRLAPLVAAGPQRAALRRRDARRRFRLDVRDQRQGDAFLAGRDVTGLVRAAVHVVLGLALLLSSGAPAFAEDAEMAKKRAAEVGLQPGMTLDQSTAALAKGLMPPEILKHYEKGEYKNQIVD